MQHDEEQIHFDELVEVLKRANERANARRSADLGAWLKEFIHRRREEGIARAARSAEWPSNQAKA
jgi:hypothetical protein